MRADREARAAVPWLTLIAAFLIVATLSAQRAQDSTGSPDFSGLASPVTTAPGEEALNQGLRVYSQGSTLHADFGASGGNLPPGQVEFARADRYPWRLVTVVALELNKYLQKAGRELREEVGDLERLEPATLRYLEETLPRELEARMRHIMVQQQLFAPQDRFLATDHRVTADGPMPPHFYTDGRGALEVLRRLGSTLEMSLSSHEGVLYDIVTAALMSEASFVRAPLGHLLDPARFPPPPDEGDIATRLGREGLPRVVIGVGGYTVGVLGILAYQLAKGGLLGYDIDFNRITLSKHLLKTDKYGFGWRVDSEGFGFDNAHAGLQLETKSTSVSLLVGGKIAGGQGIVDPETTMLFTYEILGGGGAREARSAMALVAEAHVPFEGGPTRFGGGLLYHREMTNGPGGDPANLIVDARYKGPTSDPDWHVNATYMVHKSRNSAWFAGAGVGTESPIGHRTLDRYDSRSFRNPGEPREVRGYVFFGMNF